MDEMLMLKGGLSNIECERRTKASKSNHRVDNCPRRVIPYKEYAAHRAAEKKILTAAKSILKNEPKENWDDKLLCPPRSTPTGVRSVLSSQEDKWKPMADQDPHPESVTGDSGHGTMTMTVETEPVADNKELIRAVGGTDENPSTQPCSDIEWNDEDLLIETNNENVTTHRTPAASLTPVPVSNKSEMLSPPELPEGKKPCFRELTTAQLSKSALPMCLKLDHNDAELVGYTWPPLTSVIPWIKYEAQNMMEPTWRHELQCIREDDHV